ncbi:hypothetical protein BDQ17DRAFT_1430026 [Cyathus striatus]|nr:hypothetical protein BDQ17DRAFT_1430026 [Cyathus striatus]
MDHTGLKKNAIFNVKWKSGDSSWLPYYQVSHLDALNTYLELLGVPDISQLLKGTGKPPLNNEQVFIDEDEAFLGTIDSLSPIKRSPILLLLQHLQPSSSSHSSPASSSLSPHLSASSSSTPFSHKPRCLSTNSMLRSTTLSLLTSNLTTSYSKIPPTHS